MINKSIFKFSMLLIMFIIVLSGCNLPNEGLKDSAGDSLMNYNGESETWELTGYEVELSPKSSMFGNGTLSMKTTTEYLSDYFSFEVHAKINNEDEIIHKHKSSGGQVNIAKKNIGKITGSEIIFNNEDGSLNGLSDIYMIVEWKDQQGNIIKERINLLSK